MTTIENGELGSSVRAKLNASLEKTDALSLVGGNIGINNLSPNTALDVTGTITATNIDVAGTVDGRDVSVDGLKLDGIETGATADQTAEEILTAIKTVDGTGSGLDADTLDGKQLSTIETEYQSYADTAVANLANSAPTTLDTLNELAAALGDDPNFATTIATSIGTKLPLAGGTLTGDLTVPNLITSGFVDGRDVSEDGLKLDGIEANSTADQTITAGSGLVGGGTGDVTISHANTSTQASVNGTGRTYIQDITLDTFGHVTAIGTATETVVNTTYTAGNGLDLTGTVFSHASTSTQTSLTALTGANIVSDIDVDTYGHITGLATRVLTAGDLGAITGNQTITLSGDLTGSGTTSINAQLANNVVGASELNVIGNGSNSEFLRSNGDGTFVWATPTNSDTTYTAGTGLLLTGTEFTNTITNNNQLTNGAGYITSSGSITGNANTATALETPRAIQVSGAVAGTANFDGSANINIITTANPTLTLSGDASGSATFTNLGDATLTVVVTDDSHNHSSSSGNFQVNGVLTTTGNAIVEGSLQVDGDLIISGNTVSISAVNLSIEDNMIYLNANSNVTNPDIGFAGNYNDGVYAHAGFFRDASDGYFKVFKGYTPEPDASAFIDTNHASFSLADMQAANFHGVLIGNASSANTANSLTTPRAITLSGAISGTASFDGSSDITIATSATSDPTLELVGDITGSATFTNLGSATLTAEISANTINALELNVDGDGTLGQALLSDGDGTFSWGSVSSGTIDTTSLNTDTSETIRYLTFVDSSAATGQEVRTSSAFTIISNSTPTTGEQTLKVGSSASTNRSVIEINGNNNGGSAWPELIFYDGDSAASLGQGMGRITFQNADSGANGLARIEASVLGGQDPNDGSRIAFLTTNSSGVYAERLRITETGSVQIHGAYTLPVADGTVGQILTTDGAGNVTFVNALDGTLTIDTKTTAYTVVSGDLGKIISANGTFTISLTSAITLGAGFTVTIWNVGIGEIAIDPNGTQTIDGISDPRILYPYEGIQLISNGANWYNGSPRAPRYYAENGHRDNQSRAIASGTYGIAIGAEATASGAASLSIGHQTIASAIASNAFGRGSSNVGAVAAGSGSLSFNGSYASGIDSLAGSITNNTSTYGATGSNSIAIGQLAKASSSDSIAIGKNTQSTGIQSNALGSGAKATGLYSTAIGSSLASGNYSFAAGNSLTTGSVGALGESSMAIGRSSKATMDESMAIGNSASATGLISTAVGYAAIASGMGSVVFGNSQATAFLAVALGNSSIASANTSLAIGYSAEANDDDSTAIGSSSSATGINSIAIGSSATTTAIGAIAIGMGTDATANNAVAIGVGSQSSGIGSVALGGIEPGTNSGAIATANASVAFPASRASGWLSFAALINDTSTTYGAKSVGSLAIGTGAIASGYDTVAIGVLVQATGIGAVSIGAYGVASGNESMSFGTNNVASGVRSIAIGNFASSTLDNLIALGGSADTVKISGAYTLPIADGANGQILTTDGAGNVTFADAIGGGGGTSTFLGLTDTPSSYTGGANQLVGVTPTEDGLGFTNEIQISEFVLSAVTAPATPDADAMTMYVTASGTTPNREVSYKMKNELGQEIIISSILV